MDKSLESHPPQSAAEHEARRPARGSVPAPEADAFSEAFELWTLAENLDIGVLIEDRAGRVRLANRRFCELLGTSPEREAIVGRPARHAVQKAARQWRDPDALLGWLKQVRTRRSAVAGKEFERRDGRVITADYRPVDQGPVSNLWQCRDVTEQRRAEQRLRALAQTDELTGLPNRRHALEELGREIARFKRTRRAASVLMIDVDGFKQINDGNGHAAGDRALCDLAAVLARRCRTADTAARLGGDEFLVILPETDGRGCREIAERLIREIRSAGRGGLSVSVGATSLAVVDSDEDAVLARVDHALYTAKNCGRDCVRYLDAAPQPGVVDPRETGFRPRPVP